MDDTEDDARYPPKHYSANHHSTYGSSHRQKLPIRNGSYPHPINNSYGDEADDDDAQEEDEDEENIGGEADEYDDDEDDEEDDRNGYRRIIEAGDSERRQKKRKLESLVSGYEFAPRVAPPRNSPADWSEHATFVLLEAWGDRFLQLGRKSLRSEDWHEVAEKVSEASKIERTDTQCRNRLDTLKKKYKKEKAKLEESGGGTTNKWVYFKKMDMLMASSPRQQNGLACGLDSGEYVFMNPRVYLNRSNGLDEMRDSPGNSELSEGNEDDSEGKRTRFGGDGDEGSSFRLLADSISKFGEIYEKIENSKRQQMMELEKMRMDFHRDLELQKKQILERAQAEIAKIRQGDDDEDTDVSAENLSA